MNTKNTDLFIADSREKRQNILDWPGCYAPLCFKFVFNTNTGELEKWCKYHETWCNEVSEIDLSSLDIEKDVIILEENDNKT